MHKQIHVVCWSIQNDFDFLLRLKEKLKLWNMFQEIRIEYLCCVSAFSHSRLEMHPIPNNKMICKQMINT